jgi:hypothetical protein
MVERLTDSVKRAVEKVFSFHYFMCEAAQVPVIGI